MLDQCSIQVPTPIPVNPAVFTEDNFPIGTGVLSAGSCNFRNQKANPWKDDEDDEDEDEDEDIDEERKLERRATGRINIFEDNALVVYTRSAQRGTSPAAGVDDHFIDSIMFNPAKILYGHNGRTPDTDAAICLALTYVRHALAAILVKPEDSFKLIPGLSSPQTCHWKSLEIAMNVEDKDKAIFRQMLHMRHSNIRGNPAVREKNTVYQRGSKYTLKAYDKIAQLKSRKKPKLEFHDDSPMEVTRLELQVKSAGLALEEKHAIPEGASFHRFGAKRRLVSFNFEYLKATHREQFSKLKAVYMADPESKGSTGEGHAILLAALCLTRDIPVAEVVETFATSVKRSKEACDNLRRKIEHAISRSRTLDANVLLSDENYHHQPSVSITNAMPYSRRFPLILGPDPEIRRAYAKGVPEMKFLQDLGDCRRV
jgi:hypothetical protein